MACIKKLTGEQQHSPSGFAQCIGGIVIFPSYNLQCLYKVTIGGLPMGLVDLLFIYEIDKAANMQLFCIKGGA